MSSIEELTTAFQAAQHAVEQYSRQVTEKYRDEFPRPEGWEGLPDPALLVERAQAWTEDERAELDRLRTVARDLAVELHRARQQAGGDTPAT